MQPNGNGLTEMALHTFSTPLLTSADAQGTAIKKYPRKIAVLVLEAAVGVV